MKISISWIHTCLLLLLRRQRVLVGSSSIPQEVTSEQPVQVYDNVLPDTTRELLLQECLQWKVKENVFVFSFPLKHPKHHSLIEQVLNDIMWQLYSNASSTGNTTSTTTNYNGSSRYHVEYWQRSEWHHILAHADMDEELREQQRDAIRHPESGHVLYLEVGRSVRGPTCIFTNATTGGQLLSNDETEMIVVPAVASRLLRFQGHLLHAVPRPADVWMTFQVDPSPDHSRPDYERTVLLFNTWPAVASDQPLPPPRGRSAASPNKAREETISDPEQKSPSCHDRNQWQAVDVARREATAGKSSTGSAADDDVKKTVQFPLMGDEQRRGTVQPSAMMETSATNRQAFLASKQPARIMLRPKKPRRKSWWNSLVGVEF